MYTCKIKTPLGSMTASAKDDTLTGLWFANQKYYPDTISGIENPNYPIFSELQRWLDAYFAGKSPEVSFQLAPVGTEFQKNVWNELLTIPYGKTVTYGEIARKLSVNSAQAVGGAVGHNPISILIPCHRVIGSNGKLTGYAGGVAKKKALLAIEQS